MQTRYDIEPEPVTFYPAGREYTTVILALNAVPSSEVLEDGTEVHFYLADGYEFNILNTELDKEAIKENPVAWLYYDAKKAAKQQAQGLLDKLRNGCPVVPVPSLKEGAAVCNRASDQVKLLAGLQMGGLPYFELASGEVVSLTVEQLSGIAQDVTAAETAWQMAKQQCWADIEAAATPEGITAALAVLDAELAKYVQPVNFS